MADLALAEDSFFETPSDVADELCSLVKPLLPRGRKILVVDACAGAGALGAAVLRMAGDLARVASIETDGKRLASAISAHEPRAVEPFVALDVFSEPAATLLAEADVVVMNPPFAGSRGRLVGDALAKLQNSESYPDIGCQYLLHASRLIRPGIPLGFVFRRDAFFSRSYNKFWIELGRLGSVVELREVGRRVKPDSGAAEAVIGVFVPGGEPRDCWIKQRARREGNTQGVLLSRGWRRIGDVADVRAGPSITTDIKRARTGSLRSRRVIDIPARHDGSVLWGPEFSFEMDWVPSTFSVVRNLGCQGREGFVYKLAASDFRTAILTRGYHFISATPAILPKKPYDLPFIIGCSLLPSWRDMVRDWVGSSNFTPGAVEDVFVPFSSFDLYRKISRLGAQAHDVLTNGGLRDPKKTCIVPIHVQNKIDETDDSLSRELLT